MNYDFLTRLQNGEDIVDIVNEVTDSLNEANAAYRKAQEEKRKIDRSRAEKVDIAEELLCALTDLLGTYDVDTEIFEDITAEDVVDICDEVIPVAKAYISFYDTLHEVNKAKDCTDCDCDCKSEGADPIADFLKRFVD